MTFRAEIISNRFHRFFVRPQNNLGLLSILDEECQRPANGSDEVFLNRVGQVFQDHVQLEVAWGLPSKGCDSTPVNAFRSLE